MQSLRAGSINATAGERGLRGKRAVVGSNHRLGHSVWSVWVSEGYSSAEGGGVASEPYAGGEDLEAGGVKGTPEATQEGEIMVQ